jgi:hypothetical protein
MGRVRGRRAGRGSRPGGPVPVRDKPALFTGNREIAHLEAPGVIDLRITRAGWSRARTDFGADPAVRRDPARRDWIELALRSPADLDRLGPLLAIAVAANS